jgi:hypothetical protein
VFEDGGDSVMGRKAKPCLHCSILSEIGHQLETGVIDGQQALDDLVLVVADILATVPPDRARGVMAGIIKTLSAAEARARERMKGRSTLQGKQG